MPLTAARFQEYITVYDIDLEASCAVLDETEGLILGIGMLGLREGRSWITRLGVVPYGRRLGAGKIIMQHLLDESERRQTPDLWLEVIAGNAPAHRLFQKLGFEQTRELIVARRPPSKIPLCPIADTITNIQFLDYEEALDCLLSRKIRPNWLNEPESFYHIPGLTGLSVELEDGCGWVTYESSLLQLKRVIVEVVEGDAQQVTEAILHTLHKQLPIQDAVCENISEHDPCWAGYTAAGYFETFRRIEMVKHS